MFNSSAPSSAFARPHSPVGVASPLRRSLTVSPALLESRAGLTLLEVMVALVILGLVATGFLETFAGSLRAAADSRIWAQAIVYAEDGQQLVKVDGLARATGVEVPLGGGFTRRTTVRPWGNGLARATVRVTLPNGAHFDLDHLVVAP